MGSFFLDAKHSHTSSISNEANNKRSAMRFDDIAYNSKEYKESLALREKYLRAPLGLSLSATDTKDDSNQWHFGCFDNEKLIASVTLALADSTAILRQMVVNKEYQGRKIGHQLIQYAEGRAIRHNVTTIKLSARVTAQSFYKKQGYTAVGETYTHLDIPHIKMEKELRRDSFDKTLNSH